MMMKMLKIVVFVSMLAAMCSAAVGQESLKDVIEQEGLGWMVGEWIATDDSGQEVELSWKWAASGHAITSAFKMGEDSSIGLIYLDADEQVARQIRVDSRGRATKVTWEPKDGGAIAKTQFVDEYGQSTDLAYAFSKGDAGTMKVGAYGLENGELSDNPAFAINLKAKTAAEKKKSAAAADKREIRTVADSLKDIVEQERFAWMVKAWKTTTDEGQEIEVGWKWDANGHAITSAFKMGDVVSLGLISFDADAQTVNQIIVNNRGLSTKATWEPQNGSLITKTKLFDENGESSDVAIAYSKGAADTMKVKVYGLEYGELSDNPWFEANFN